MLFCVVAVFYQCGKGGSEIIYEGEISARTLFPKPTIMNDTFKFSWPRDIVIIDSLLIVHDSYLQEYGFHVFNKYNGKHIGGFGRKGRASGEFMDANSMNSNNDGRSITVFDPNLKRAIIFDVVNILQKKRTLVS